ncbi:MAG: hypothetical protein IPL53_12120 [Ignavibacteria bacterium]|nr:hypothetical protein [Ignavibacteria bacterium]
MLAILISLNSKTFAQANSVRLNGATLFSNIETAYAAILPGFATPQLVEILPIYDGSLELFPISLNLIAGTSTITIRPEAGNNGEIVASITTNNYLFRLEGCNNVIIDGRPGGVTSVASNYLTVNNDFNTAANGNAGTALFNGADNCIYQYINATAALGTLAFTGARNINIAGAAANPSNNNIVQNCVVVGGLRGIQNFGLDAATINQNNIIRHNNISQTFNWGMLISNDNNTLIQHNKVHYTSAITTVATFLVGIQIQGNNTRVDQNEVVGMTSLNAANYLHMSNFGSNSVFTRNKIHDNVSTAVNVITVGIQLSGTVATQFTENEIYNLASSTSFVLGINVASNGAAFENLTITKNEIKNLFATATAGVYGMSVSPRTGNTVNITYNNISLHNANNSASGVFGINATFATGATPSLDYTCDVRNNAVYIGGVNLGTVGGPFVNSAGIWRDNNGPLSVYTQRDNNVINERTTGDANFQIHAGFWLDTLTGTLDLDNNNYYASDPNGGLAAIWYDSLFENTNIVQYHGYAAPEEANTTFGNVNFLKLTMNFEACPDKSPVTVELRNATSPYALVESSAGIAGGDFANVIEFGNAVEGTPYYVVVKSINMIETWSASTVTFNSSGANYDFTSSISQAFGGNQTLSGSGIPSVYQGDVNQNGFVDLTDVTITYGFVQSFTTSAATDLDCNGSTDLSDLITVFNNAKAFVSVEKPTAPVSIIPQTNKNQVTSKRIKTVGTPEIEKRINNDVIGNGTMDR